MRALGRMGRAYESRQDITMSLMCLQRALTLTNSICQEEKENSDISFQSNLRGNRKNINKDLCETLRTVGRVMLCKGDIKYAIR